MLRTALHRWLNLRAVNNVLTVVVALVALYIVFAPFLPQLHWWFTHDSPVRALVHEAQTPAPTAAPNGSEQPASNQLFISRLEMQEAVHSGDIAALRKGVWRLPHTSTPDKGGNTVLVGHRFTYDGKAVFYHLDKVRQGDRITLSWQGKLYEYEVYRIVVVPPTEVSIEADTPEPRLTIYTCTPLLTAKDRLVLQAKLRKESP